MDVGTVIAAGGLIGSTILLFRLPAFWRGETSPSSLASMRPVWPFGESSLRGAVRAGGLGLVGFAGLMVAALGGDLVHVLEQETVVRFVIATLALTGDMVALVCLAGSVSVVLFNRPRIVVPPSMRDQPGVISAWRMGRRSRR